MYIHVIRYYRSIASLHVQIMSKLNVYRNGVLIPSASISAQQFSFDSPFYSHFYRSQILISTSKISRHFTTQTPALIIHDTHKWHTAQL